MRLGQLHITVSDIDRSVAFYRDVLGADLLFTVPEQAMAFLQAGDTRLYLGEAESPELASRPLAYYRVDDLDAEFARISAAGVTFSAAPHLVHSDGVTELRLAFLTDPDGIVVGLMEERPLSGSAVSGEASRP